ncbi:MAG: hypothetical protein E7418_03085 [Ruminococcaceae bacterium]|nr:hypothetical protein [Oscillospiraceae bacterium]
MELHYFLTTNGSGGHTSYMQEALDGYRDVIHLEGYPRGLAAKLIRECYAEAKKQDVDIEMIHNTLDNSPEGILLPQNQTALINTPLYDADLSLSALMINERINTYQKHMQKAWKHFKEALAVHDEWEKIYKDATDYVLLNQFTSEKINQILQDEKRNETGTLCHRFFGSATVNGSVDYIEVLSAGLKRYFIKGRPGTGKSTFMKELAKKAKERGFIVECYHCAFDPVSYDMVAIRDLNLCLFDATPPHEYSPTESTDEVIDLYQAAVAPDTDTRFSKELSSVSMEYKNEINAAVKHLMLANEAALSADEENERKIDHDRVMIALQTIMSRLFISQN